VARERFLMNGGRKDKKYKFRFA